MKRTRIGLLVAAVAALGCMYGCGVLPGLSGPSVPPDVTAGMEKLRAGDEEGAKALFERAIGAEPKNPIVYILPAHAFAEAGRPDRTIAYAERGLAATAGADARLHAQLYSLKGSALLELGDAPRALEANRAALRLMPDDTGLMNNLAYSMSELTSSDQYLREAEELATKAVTQAQSHDANTETLGIYIDTLGWVQFRAGKTAESLVALTHAAYLVPGQPEVLYHLARAFQANGRGADAAVMLRRAIKLKPGFARAQQALEEIRMYDPTVLEDEDLGREARMKRE